MMQVPTPLMYALCALAGYGFANVIIDAVLLWA